MSVRVDASRTNRSLSAAAAGPSKRPQLQADPVLLTWRRLIDTAVAEAKKTKFGLPTYQALLQRMWIQEHRPKQTEATWLGSFPCACHFLSLDADAERTRLLADIDDSITRAVMRYVGDQSYQMRARALTCAGIATAIAVPCRSGKTVKQLVLGLVSLEDYEEIAGVEHPAPPPRKPKLGGGRRHRQHALAAPSSEGGRTSARRVLPAT